MSAPSRARRTAAAVSSAKPRAPHTTHTRTHTRTRARTRTHSQGHSQGQGGAAAEVAFDFADAGFWEKAYGTTSEYDAFEWYLPLTAYTHILTPLLPHPSGLGSSTSPALSQPVVSSTSPSTSQVSASAPAVPTALGTDGGDVATAAAEAGKLRSRRKLARAVEAPAPTTPMPGRSGADGVAASSCRILNLGCGSSALPRELYAAGYPYTVNVDISESCIKKMTRDYAKTCPEVQFRVADVLTLAEEADASYDVVLDKATSDVFMAAKDTSAATANVLRMFRAAWRVLKPGGTFIIITRYRPTKYSPMFAELGWRVGHKSVPAPRVYHGKVHVYVTVKPMTSGTPVKAGKRRVSTTEDACDSPAHARLAKLGITLLSETELNAEDSGGSDDETDSDDSSFCDEGSSDD